MRRQVVLAKQHKSKTQSKLGPYRYRAGSKYDQVARVAGEKPRGFDELVKACVRRTGIPAQHVIYDIRVLCDENNRSNNHKTRNRFGRTTAKVHLKAIGS